jgi:diguanylate cyclase (GGDEF)-like protein/PAS domain S-box-containing protein
MSQSDTTSDATVVEHVDSDEHKLAALSPVVLAAMDAARIALLVVDAHGVVVHANAPALQLLAFDQLQGKSVSTLLPDETGGLIRFIGVDPQANSFPHRRFMPCLRGDGSQFTVEMDIIRAGHGADAHFAAVLKDVPMFSSLGEEWGVSEERVSSIAANMPGIIFQRVRQPDGIVYYPFFSDGVREILGYEPEDMKTADDGCLDVIHWADRDDYLNRMRESANTLEPSNEEFRVITRNGSVKWLRGTTRPEPMPNGDILWDGILLDESERKKAEYRLEMIMDHAADCIITMNEVGEIESVNAAVEDVFGYFPEDLIGKSAAVLSAEFQMKGSETFDPQILSAEIGFVGAGPQELSGRHKNGGVFPIEMSLSEVRADGSRIFIAVVRDITNRRHTELQLAEKEQMLRGIADNIPGLVFQRRMQQDGTLEFTYMSEGVRDILECGPDQVMADMGVFFNAMGRSAAQIFRDAHVQSAKTLDPMEDNIHLVNAKGREFYLRGWARPRRLGNGDVIWDGVALDVTERRQAEERLMFLAYYDPLTGLGNRSLFLDKFDEARRDAKVSSYWVGVLSVGVDRFSMINATLGHSVGDRVLRAIGRRLQENAGRTDFVARASGDRFLVLAGHLRGQADVEKAVKQIQHAFVRPLLVDGQEFDVTVSVGSASYPHDGLSAETLIMHADAALTLAKSHGLGGYQFFTEEMGAKAADTLSMQQRLRRALDNNEFVAYFQPQVSTRTGEIIGMEALVRWIDPERGLVPPGRFIPIAEEYGLIDDICIHVLEDTGRWSQRLREQGLPTIPIAVNISGRQFNNARGLLQSVQTVLDRYGLDPGQLELELTESSAMSDPETAIHVVQVLSEQGIKCAIDDFGTGYSSLSVLKRFPIRKLKLDRSFIMDVTTDPGDAAIVSAMVAMAHALDLRVVAEGVETTEHLEFLHSLGCDQIQGYLFSPPVPGEEIEKMLREGRVLEACLKWSGDEAPVLL